MNFQEIDWNLYTPLKEFIFSKWWILLNCEQQ